MVRFIRALYSWLLFVVNAFGVVGFNCGAF